MKSLQISALVMVGWPPRLNHWEDSVALCRTGEVAEVPVLSCSSRDEMQSCVIADVALMFLAPPETVLPSTTLMREFGNRGSGAFERKAF